MSRISIFNATAEDFALEIFASEPVDGSVGDHANGRIVKYGEHIYVWCNHQGIWAKFANVSDFTSLETRLSQQEDANDTDVASLEVIDASLEVRISTEEASRATAVSSINVVDVAVELSNETRLIAEEVARAADVVSESTRAGDAETSIATVISQAVVDREAAASSEQARAEAAEGSLETRLSGEEVNRASEDSSLTTRLAAEESARASGEHSNVSSLVNANGDRVSVDASLETRLSTEEDRVDAILAASSADKDSFAEVVSFINAIDLSHDTQTSTEFSSQTSSIASMESSLEGIDTSLETRLSGEEVQRASDDSSLETRISEEEDAMIADAGSLTTRKSTEESTRLAADNSLGGRMGVNEVARAAADTSIESRLSTEEDAMAAADSSLETLLSGDASDRASADTSIETRMSEEESAMLSAVASEEVVRIAADDSLELLVSAEEVTRSQMDDYFDTVITSGSNFRISQDSSLESRLSDEESSEVADKGSLETRLSNEEDSMAAGDSSVETRFSNEVSTEKSRIDAILDSADADKDTFVELVSLITVFDGDADDALASYQLVIDSRISAEESNMAAGDASLEAELSSKIVERQSAITSLETKHSGEISTLAASIGSLETREGSRHLRVDFGGSAPVTSFTVPGTSFPAGFKMDEHGMVQVFQDIGSNKFRHLVAPVAVDMTSGDITVQLGSSAKAGFAVFYMFADDEGAVTEPSNASQFQIATSNSSYDANAPTEVSETYAGASAQAYLYIVDLDNASYTTSSEYGYTTYNWTLNTPLGVDYDSATDTYTNQLAWGNVGETGAYIRWYSQESTDGGVSWGSTQYTDTAVTLSEYGAQGTDNTSFPSTSPAIPAQGPAVGSAFKIWAEGYDVNGNLLFTAGSESAPYYNLDTDHDFQMYSGSHYTSSQLYWHSSGSSGLNSVFGQQRDITFNKPSSLNVGDNFSDAIANFNANYNSYNYGWDSNLTSWALTGTHATEFDIVQYTGGDQQSASNTAYISLLFKEGSSSYDRPVPASGTYTVRLTASNVGGADVIWDITIVI